MNDLRQALSWGTAVMLTVCCCGAALLAQSRSDGVDGSLTALTAELRQLRVAVEELGRSQTQTQALAVYLSVQQSRIVQVANRLDAAQKDVDSATLRSQDVETRLANLTDELPRATEPQRRAALQDGIRGMKAEERHLDLELQQARGRESELSQGMQLEVSRWNDLISRLEQLISK